MFSRIIAIEVCMMFVGFRMRVLQLSKGTGNPQDWVRMSMQVSPNSFRDAENSFVQVKTNIEMQLALRPSLLYMQCRRRYAKRAMEVR